MSSFNGCISPKSQSVGNFEAIKFAMQTFNLDQTQKNQHICILRNQTWHTFDEYDMFRNDIRSVIFVHLNRNNLDNSKKHQRGSALISKTEWNQRISSREKIQVIIRVITCHYVFMTVTVKKNLDIERLWGRTPIMLAEKSIKAQGEQELSFLINDLCPNWKP